MRAAGIAPLMPLNAPAFVTPAAVTSPFWFHDPGFQGFPGELLTRIARLSPPTRPEYQMLLAPRSGTLTL